MQSLMVIEIKYKSTNLIRGKVRGTPRATQSSVLRWVDIDVKPWLQPWMAGVVDGWSRGYR
jgi:hypothetical protein